MTADTVKHTKGPWLVRPHWNDEARFEVYPDREVEFGEPAEIADVCAHYADDFTREITEAKANAHLIAAAPDLLAALKEVIAVLKAEAPGTSLNNEKYNGVGIAAYAAIAKAEGRS